VNPHKKPTPRKVLSQPKPVIFLNGDEDIVKKYIWLVRKSIILRRKVISETTEKDLGDSETVSVCIYTMRAPKGNVFKLKVEEIHFSTVGYWREEKNMHEIEFKSKKIVFKKPVQFEYDSSDMEYE